MIEIWKSNRHISFCIIETSAVNEASVRPVERRDHSPFAQDDKSIEVLLSFGRRPRPSLPGHNGQGLEGFAPKAFNDRFMSRASRNRPECVRIAAFQRISCWRFSRKWAILEPLSSDINLNTHHIKRLWFPPFPPDINLGLATS